MRPHVTDRDRLYLLRATSSSEVRNFLDRQPSRTKSDYQLLREVLIKEFTDPDSEHGLLTCLRNQTRSTRGSTSLLQPTPTSLLWCTQRTWPWRGCELQKPLPKKSAPWSQPPSRRHGLSTLHDHPTVAWPNTEGLQQAEDGLKERWQTSTLLNSVNKDSSLALDDTQMHHKTRVLHQEHRERDPHVHESYQPNFWKNPWDQPCFSRNAKDSNNWKPNQTSKGNRLTHPRASRRVKRQRNPPQHYSDMHSAEYAPEPYSLPSEDMEQVMSQLNEFLQDKLNTDDYEIESCSLWPTTERKADDRMVHHHIQDDKHLSTTTQDKQVSHGHRWWKLRYQRTSPHSPITH